MTAADAYVRDVDIYAPRDCIASRSAGENRKALDYMARVFRANTSESSRLNVKKLAGTARKGVER